MCYQKRCVSLAAIASMSAINTATIENVIRLFHSAVTILKNILYPGCTTPPA